MHFVDASGADSVLPFNSGMQKIKITNITPVSTVSNPVDLLYDGVFDLSGSDYSKACFARNSGDIALTITVDRPFKLLFVRVPYLVSGGVYNPAWFTIGNYTSNQRAGVRAVNTWTTMPYIDNINCDGLSLGTTFTIILHSGGASYGVEHTGMSELEFYGFYE